MKPKQKQTDELTELFDELNIDASATSEMRHDIQAGDALLNEQGEPNCPDELFERVAQDIEKQHCHSGTGRNPRLPGDKATDGSMDTGLRRYDTLRRIAAVLVLGFVLVGLFV